MKFSQVGDEIIEISVFVILEYFSVIHGQELGTCSLIQKSVAVVGSRRFMT